MKIILRIFLATLLLTGTFSQNGFDLSDALDDLAKVTPKPKEKAKVNEPKSGGTEGFSLDLEDALGPEEPKKPAVNPPKSGGGTGDFLDLEDALGPEEPKKPAVNPTEPRGGGGSFSDSDLLDINNDGYKPEGGRPGGGDSGYDSNDGAEQPKEGSGAIAAIASTIGVALLGAASSYFAYQKKKLCFKIQGGQDPESGKHHEGNQSDNNQVFSNLMRNS